MNNEACNTIHCQQSVNIIVNIKIYITNYYNIQYITYSMEQLKGLNACFTCCATPLGKRKLKKGCALDLGRAWLTSGIHR